MTRPNATPSPSHNPGANIPELDPENTISSVDRALRIVEYVQRNDGIALSALTDEFDIAKSTAHRHLKTLREHGYLVKEGEEYHVGLRFLDPGIHAQQRKEAHRIIRPKVEQLAAETGERAQFITEENGVGIHVHSAIGERGIDTESRVGKLAYLHATSAGKCILSELPESRVDQIVDRYGLPALTANTITDRDELAAELAKIREQGYAFNDAERRARVRAVGVPITGPDDGILGGLSVTGPTRRMEGHLENELLDQLLDAADEIMLRLEYS